ncbi:MAG: DUF2141 domain-containing protein [Chitinophagaceae bacterium]|nr:DUF2141 domain-containing protein [Chitinophagaceae bacterium]
MKLFAEPSYYHQQNSNCFFRRPCFWQLSIAILHDENDDGKMNSNFLGLPKEGYGFSNNVMGNFGPPLFQS